jgi:hypothetical protein
MEWVDSDEKDFQNWFNCLEHETERNKPEKNSLKSFLIIFTKYFKI